MTAPMNGFDRVMIRLSVNGEETEVAFDPYKTLLEVLREDLQCHRERRSATLLSVARRGMPRAVDSNRRRPCDWSSPPSSAGCVCGLRRGTVRLFHAGDAPHGGGSSMT